MTVLGPVPTLLAVHATVLVASLGVYGKYRNTNEAYNKSKEGLADCFRAVRMLVSDRLARAMKALCERDQAVPTMILSPEGRAYTDGVYSERSARVFEGEAFKHCVHKFVEANADALADCALMSRARRNWLSWLKRLAWASLGLLCWQLAMCVVYFLAWRLHKSFWTTMDVLSFAPTLIFCSIAAISFLFMQKSENSIIDTRGKYDDV